MTIAKFIEMQLGGRGEVGDRVALGDIELVVRDVEESGAIKSVGLSIEPRASRAGSLPIFLNAHEMLARFRRRNAKERPNESNARSQTPEISAKCGSDPASE